MKLKKIVSLALAGILAVSMLAGCGNNTNPNPDSNPDEGNTVVGYSSVFYNRLGADINGTAGERAQVKINMADSSQLTADLNRAMQNLTSATIIDYTAAIRGTGRTVINFADAIPVPDDLRVIAREMDGLFTGIGTAVAADDGTAFGNLIPNYREVEDDTVVMLWAVDINVTEQAAVEQVADEIVEGIAALEISDDIGSTSNDSTTLHYEYNGSVSVATRELADNHGMGMRIVAVEITRSAKA